MKYIKQCDFEYIINKYHDASKPFDGYARFIRRDMLFTPEAGMAPEDILAGIWKNDILYQDLPHSIRKARALEYVLKNTRVSCDTRDIFPAINMVDRPLSQTLIKKWTKEILTEVIPEVEARRSCLENNGVTIWPDYDHSVPVWDRLFSLGLVGLLGESERMRKKSAFTEVAAP